MSEVSYYEKMVRKHWEFVMVGRIDHDSYGPDEFYVDIGPTKFKNVEPQMVWKEAWEYTLLVLQKIERIEDQLAWVKKQETEFPEDQRAQKGLAASIELALEDVKKGFYDCRRR